MTEGWRKKPMSPEARKLALMRAAKTAANSHGLGGREKEKGYKPRPVTLPKTPWDEMDSPADRGNDA